MRIFNLIQTAAAAILTTGAAMAQGPMTARVPFAFQFSGVDLPAGEYRVDTSRTLETGLVLMQNAGTNQAVIRIGVPDSPKRGSDDRPRLVFRCGAESGCVLSQVWSPVTGAHFAAPKGAEPRYTASIPLITSKAD